MTLIAEISSVGGMAIVWSASETRPVVHRVLLPGGGIRERIRALGPTIRVDLGKQAAAGA